MMQGDNSTKDSLESSIAASFSSEESFVGFDETCDGIDCFDRLMLNLQVQLYSYDLRTTVILFNCPEHITDEILQELLPANVVRFEQVQCLSLVTAVYVVQLGNPEAMVRTSKVMYRGKRIFVVPALQGTAINRRTAVRVRGSNSKYRTELVNHGKANVNTRLFPEHSEEFFYDHLCVFGKIIFLLKSSNFTFVVFANEVQAVRCCVCEYIEQSPVIIEPVHESTDSYSYWSKSHQREFFNNDDYGFSGDGHLLEVDIEEIIDAKSDSGNSMDTDSTSELDEPTASRFKLENAQIVLSALPQVQVGLCNLSLEDFMNDGQATHSLLNERGSNMSETEQLLQLLAGRNPFVVVPNQCFQPILATINPNQSNDETTFNKDITHTTAITETTINHDAITVAKPLKNSMDTKSVMSDVVSFDNDQIVEVTVVSDDQTNVSPDHANANETHESHEPYAVGSVQQVDKKLISVDENCARILQKYVTENDKIDLLSLPAVNVQIIPIQFRTEIVEAACTLENELDDVSQRAIEAEKLELANVDTQTTAAYVTVTEEGREQVENGDRPNEKVVSTVARTPEVTKKGNGTVKRKKRKQSVLSTRKKESKAIPVSDTKMHVNLIQDDDKSTDTRTKEQHGKNTIVAEPSTKHKSASVKIQNIANLIDENDVCVEPIIVNFPQCKVSVQKLSTDTECPIVACRQAENVTPCNVAEKSNEVVQNEQPQKAAVNVDLSKANTVPLAEPIQYKVTDLTHDNRQKKETVKKKHAAKVKTRKLTGNVEGNIQTDEIPNGVHEPAENNTVPNVNSAATEINRVQTENASCNAVPTPTEEEKSCFSSPSKDSQSSKIITGFPASFKIPKKKCTQTEPSKESSLESVLRCDDKEISPNENRERFEKEQRNRPENGKKKDTLAKVNRRWQRDNGWHVKFAHGSNTSDAQLVDGKTAMSTAFGESHETSSTLTKVQHNPRVVRNEKAVLEVSTKGPITDPLHLGKGPKVAITIPIRKSVAPISGIPPLLNGIKDHPQSSRLIEQEKDPISNVIGSVADAHLGEVKNNGVKNGVEQNSQKLVSPQSKITLDETDRVKIATTNDTLRSHRSLVDAKPSWKCFAENLKSTLQVAVTKPLVKTQANAKRVSDKTVLKQSHPLLSRSVQQKAKNSGAASKYTAKAVSSVRNLITHFNNQKVCSSVEKMQLWLKELPEATTPPVAVVAAFEPSKADIAEIDPEDLVPYSPDWGSNSCDENTDCEEMVLDRNAPYSPSMPITDIWQYFEETKPSVCNVREKKSNTAEVPKNSNAVTHKQRQQPPLVSAPPCKPKAADPRMQSASEKVVENEKEPELPTKENHDEPSDIPVTPSKETVVLDTIPLILPTRQRRSVVSGIPKHLDSQAGLKVPAYDDACSVGHSETEGNSDSSVNQNEINIEPSASLSSGLDCVRGHNMNSEDVRRIARDRLKALEDKLNQNTNGKNETKQSLPDDHDQDTEDATIATPDTSFLDSIMQSSVTRRKKSPTVIAISPQGTPQKQHPLEAISNSTATTGLSTEIVTVDAEKQFSTPNDPKNNKEQSSEFDHRTEVSVPSLLDGIELNLGRDRKRQPEDGGLKNCPTTSKTALTGSSFDTASLLNELEIQINASRARLTPSKNCETKGERKRSLDSSEELHEMAKSADIAPTNTTPPEYVNSSLLDGMQINLPRGRKRTYENDLEEGIVTWRKDEDQVPQTIFADSSLLDGLLNIPDVKKRQRPEGNVKNEAICKSSLSVLKRDDENEDRVSFWPNLSGSHENTDIRNPTSPNETLDDLTMEIDALFNTACNTNEFITGRLSDSMPLFFHEGVEPSTTEGGGMENNGTPKTTSMEGTDILLQSFNTILQSMEK